MAIFLLTERLYSFLFLERVNLLLFPASIHSKRKGFGLPVTLRIIFF